MTTVSVIIPTWDGLNVLRLCLQSLSRQTRPADEVVVVDNGSVDGTQAELQRDWPAVRVIRLATNHGFAGGVNAGLAAATGDRLVLLNNDAEADVDFLEELLRADAQAGPRVAAVTAKVLGRDGRLQDTGDFLTRWGLPVQRGRDEPDDGRYDADLEVTSACGGACLWRREALDQVGVFAEEFFAYFEDLDLGLRARLAGWQIHYAPRAVVRHAVSATSSRIPNFQQFHNTRNLWWLVIRCAPSGVLLRLLLWQVKGLVGAVGRGQLRVTLRAHAAAAAGLPAALRGRRANQQLTVLNRRQARALLSPSRRVLTVPAG